jgi:hypothetical protein
MRTILYYPTIVIPDGLWLRQALLYFDNVGSIVPDELSWGWRHGGSQMPEHMKMLEGEGEYKQFVPRRDLIFHNTRDLQSEILDVVKSKSLAQHQPQGFPPTYTKIYTSKIWYWLLSALNKTDLILPESPSDGFCRMVESTTANFILGVVATAIAERANEGSVEDWAEGREPVTVVTGTDLRRHETLIWKTRNPSNGDPVVEATFLGLLPTPPPDVDLAKIIAFKQTHRDQLLQFRVEMDRLADELAKSEHPAHTAVVWRERLERELGALAKSMQESGWEAVWTSIKAMFDLQQLGAVKTLAALGIGAGVTTGAISVPVAGAGLAVAGSIQLTSSVIEHRRRKHDALSKSPFSFLMSARSDGLID